MGESLWEVQHKINVANMNNFKDVWDMVSKLAHILEDHERDMIKMCNKINELEKELNKLKEGK